METTKSGTSETTKALLSRSERAKIAYGVADSIYRELRSYNNEYKNNYGGHESDLPLILMHWEWMTEYIRYKVIDTYLLEGYKYRLSGGFFRMVMHYKRRYGVDAKTAIKQISEIPF